MILTGRKRAWFRGYKYVLHELLDWRAQNPPEQSIQPRLARIWPYWLHCLAGGFYAVQSRIYYKIYLEPLKHALLHRLGFVDVFYNFIQNSLSKLWQSWQYHCQVWIQIKVFMIKLCEIPIDESITVGFDNFFTSYTRLNFLACNTARATATAATGTRFLSTHSSPERRQPRS